MLSSLAILAATASLAHAVVVPLTPATSNAGAPCLIQYTPDTTGTWTNATVLLRSGSNLAMTTVTPILSGFDATTGGEIIWTCPSVTPNSAIYFYEFNLGGLTPQWTTRFAIASASGATTTPTNPTQPGGEAIPWGLGKLSAGATVATASISGAVSGGAASTKPVSGSSAAVSSAAVSSAAVTTSSAASSSSASSSSSSSSSSGSSSSSSSSSASAASAAATTKAAGAGREVMVGSGAMVVAAFLAVFA
ncbi:hypothetical protein RQP46_001534 [Phenoliferia psychrophenolica]